MSLSRERVRQIVCGTIEVQKSTLVNNDDWDYYNQMFELAFIYEKTEEYVKLIEVEHLPISFDVFASLLVLVADFKIEEVDGHSILINNKYRELKFTDCIDTLFSIIDGNCSTDTFVPLETILFTVPNQYKSSTKHLIDT